MQKLIPQRTQHLHTLLTCGNL